MAEDVVRAETPGAGSGDLREPKPEDHLQGRRRYRIERRLGLGGFGTIFLATCVDRDADEPDDPPEQVALKLIRVPSENSTFSLLKQELSALLALRHDRIPRVYDWSLEPPVAFVVTDYFAGGSLEDVAPYVGALDERMAWRLLSDLLAAVNAAHQASILHLDIKPANVLLDGKGGFVLTDFGVSRGSRVSEDVVPHGTGSPGFQSPEQSDPFGIEVDTRTDLWGVGVTLWRMLVGATAWQLPSLSNGVDGQGLALPRLSIFRPICDPELEEIVMSLLHTDREARPGGAAEVLARVRARTGDGGAAPDAGEHRVSRAEAADVVAGLVDPLWASICSRTDPVRHFARYEDGEALGEEGEDAHYTHLLLQGCVEVERGGRCIDVERREGTFLGEIATLTGQHRTATMRARGTVWTCTFNAAELERFVASNPAVGIRLVRSLAHRLHKERTES